MEEEGFGFAVLKAEDLAIATDVDFSLLEIKPVSLQLALVSWPQPKSLLDGSGRCTLVRVYWIATIDVLCQDRSSHH